MLKKLLGTISLLCILSGCASLPENTAFTGTTHVVQRTVVVRPPLLKMQYALHYGNNPALKRAYETYIKTGKAPTIETDGFVQFAYGTGTQPIIAASPFELTVISLEPGENVTNVSSGDPTRWSYSMAYSGAGKLRQAHIMVKPSSPRISTDLVITTDRRLYTLKMVAGVLGGKYVRNVRFWYPGEVQAFWDHYNAEQTLEIQQNTTVAEVPNLNVDHLNFAYSVSCGGFFCHYPLFRPVRVFDDGVHTYIQLPHTVFNRDLPALFVLSGNQKELVNYRTKTPYFVVDKIFHEAILIEGVGMHQAKIIIINHRY